MTKENIKISADGFNAYYIKTLSQNSKIYRVHIGCIENNYNAIEKSKGIENAVVHILINRIDSIEKLKSKLIDFKVKRILLLNGNPHPKPYKHNFIEVLEQLKPIVDVFVAAYPTTYLHIQTKKHITKQIYILKKKINAGAKEIFLQESYNIHKLSMFFNALQENNINIPLNYGLSPNVSIRQISVILKEIIHPLPFFLNPKNLDFLFRILITNNNRAASFYYKLINSFIFRDIDGLHLTTLDTSFLQLFYKSGIVKQVGCNDFGTSNLDLIIKYI